MRATLRRGNQVDGAFDAFAVIQAPGQRPLGALLLASSC
jgi:hypothetical protein